MTLAIFMVFKKEENFLSIFLFFLPQQNLNQLNVEWKKSYFIGGKKSPLGFYTLFTKNKFTLLSAVITVIYRQNHIRKNFPHPTMYHYIKTLCTFMPYNKKNVYVSVIAFCRQIAINFLKYYIV